MEVEELIAAMEEKVRKASVKLNKKLNKRNDEVVTEHRKYIGREDEMGKALYEGDLVRNESGRVMVIEWFNSPSFIGWDLRVVVPNGKPQSLTSMWTGLYKIGSL